MAVSSVQMYIAFQKLFQAEEATKKQALSYGVREDDFNSVDLDHNEYLEIDEALQNYSISELLYSEMASVYGTGEADDAERKTSGSSTTIETGKNPFKSDL